jgi:hypothetical protein
MKEKEIYDRAVSILDNYLVESQTVLSIIENTNDWKKGLIHKLFRQSSHILYALLSNSENSTFQNSLIVKDPIVMGSLGRIIREIYVNIIYLKTNRFPEDQMKLCWDFQTVCQQLNVVEYEALEGVETQIEFLKNHKEKLLNGVKSIKCKTISQILQGKEEKLLSLEELAAEKGFHRNKFYREFQFFSQFSHSTAFANSFIIDGKVSITLIAGIYDRIVPYYVGIVTEALHSLLPDYEHLSYLQIKYKEIILNRWNPTI